MASWTPITLNGRPGWSVTTDGVTYIVCHGPSGGEATVLAGGVRRFLPGHSHGDDDDALRGCVKRFHQRLMAMTREDRAVALLSPMGIAA